MAGFGRELPNAVAAELGREPADVLVVDYLMKSAAGLAAELPVPHAQLIHTLYRFHGGANGDDPALVVMPREWDDWPDPPGHVAHVGPIFEEAAGAGWESPGRPPTSARSSSSAWAPRT